MRVSVSSGWSAARGGAGTTAGLAAGKGGHHFPGLFRFAFRAGESLLFVGGKEDLFKFLTAFGALKFIYGHFVAPPWLLAVILKISGRNVKVLKICYYRYINMNK